MAAMAEVKKGKAAETSSGDFIHLSSRQTETSIVAIYNRLTVHEERHHGRL